MDFAAVSTLGKTPFHVFPPTPLGTFTYQLNIFSKPTSIGTPTFCLERFPQVETVVVGWTLRLTVPLCEFKFFYLNTLNCRS